MKTKNTYIVPNTVIVMLSTRDKVMQETLQNTFSGGDRLGTGIVICEEADESDEDSRANKWANHLWEEFE